MRRRRSAERVPDWYRNNDWNDAVAADFEARLARARGQKAQYLRIQGATLRNSHPQVAIALLQRCVELGDPAFTAAALLDTAQARYGIGDIDAALDTLETLLDQEACEPRFRTSAAFDYPFLVALHGQRQRFDRAMAVLEASGEGLFADLNFERETALALIYAERGEHWRAAEAAMRALQAADVSVGWITSFPQVGVVPVGDHPPKQRLKTIAGRLDS
jgi:tetratricopeptide (TPR) repeat protein